MKNTLENLLQEAQQNNSGFSFNPSTNQTNPTKGYMVSRPEYEAACGRDVLVNFGMKYYNEHKEVLDSNANLYIGCWYNNGTFYLDISENVQTLEVATQLGLHYNQLAIWDCAENEAIEMPIRECSCCGKRSQRVYVFNDGDFYACSDADDCRHVDKCRDTISEEKYGKLWEELSTNIDEDGEDQVHPLFYYTEFNND